MNIFFGIGKLSQEPSTSVRVATDFAAAAFSATAFMLLILSMFERMRTFHNPYLFRTAAVGFPAYTST